MRYEHFIQNYEESLSAVGVDISDFSSHGTYMCGCCPVHEGDNQTAFTLYYKTGRWLCHTQHCHEGKGRFIDLLFMLYKKNINTNGSFSDMLKHVEQSVANDIIPEYTVKNKEIVLETPEKEYVDIPILDFKRDRQRSNFFVKDGLSLKTSDKFMISFCEDEIHPMFNRVYVPILSDDATKVVGYTGRTTYPECEKCGNFHHPRSRCPEDGGNRVPKWKHYFHKSHYLYNFWNLKSKTVVITEGPKDVWFLDQYGIYNAVATCGSSISHQHCEKLKKIGVDRVVLFMDNDEGGRVATDSIIKHMKSYDFVIKDIKNLLEVGKDPADIQSKDISIIKQEIEYA